MDILSLSAADYRSLATWLDGRANEIELVMPQVVKSVGSVTFEGKFAARAKSQLRGFAKQADAGADSVRAAAAVARRQADALETAQRAEIARRAAAAARELAQRARDLLGGS